MKNMEIGLCSAAILWAKSLSGFWWIHCKDKSIDFEVLTAVSFVDGYERLELDPIEGLNSRCLLMQGSYFDKRIEQ